MDFTWTFSTVFAKEFSNLPEIDQNKILDFTSIYEKHGLGDFTNYVGKISHSWSGIDSTSPDYSYAFDNSLWHYHIGIPTYSSFHPKYKTSEFLLHFQWPDKGPHINIVDLYSHYTHSDHFYLPPTTYLVLED